MSRELVIRRVELLGDDRMWGWSFERGVNVIVGPVGTGKTTLLNLISFGLGGSWAPTKKARESASAVRLQVRADETWLQVRRDFGANEVIVTVDQGHERRLRLRNAPSGQTTFSDLLLDLLGLPKVRVPTSRAKASKRRTSITFNDVMSYLYLEQTDIDRQTARSDDRILGPKRLYVFELLYGLLDEASARLQLEAGERADERKQLNAEQRLLERWAQRYQEALSQTLSAETSRAAYESASRELETLENDGSSATLNETRQQFESVSAETGVMRAELSRLDDVCAQLELDVERMLRGAEATAKFQAFDYVVCPRCLQDLHLEHPSDHCSLCGQVDAQAPSETAIADERQRRIEQLQESIVVRDAMVERLEMLDREQSEVAERVASLSEANAAVQQRRFALTAQRARTAREVELAEALPRPDFMVRELTRRVDEVVQVEDAIAKESEERAQAIESRRQDLDELSTIFRQILVLFDLPWFEGEAFIDPKSYLPMVDGQTLTELSSGGMKATVNLAYYLSNLVFSLREPTALLPRFLMIDGLRKDFGAGAQDLARADAIYRFLLTQQATMTGPPPSPFQLLVVDNDLPAGISGEVNVIELDYESPLISDHSED